MLKADLEIKDYTLKTFLGKGSFGEVWLAEKKIEIADKRVPFALKFISGNQHGISDYATVKREINTWIDASGHKNIISVQDGFIYEDFFVIVSEYANNGSLRQWLRTQGGKIASLEKCVEIMGGILDGLTHLHSQNIIHRDLKPENVLLKGDVPCIADFGVSRIVENNSLEISAGTNTAGSPLYMSPESFERIKPAPQIDIWSAGIMLFEMLSGKTPYSADTIPGLIYEIVTKEPRSLPHEIPQSFQQVVKKALAKDIADRFSTAKEMREALMRALYSQHLDFVDDEAATLKSDERQETRTNAKASEIHLMETLPLSKEMTAAEVGGNKKTFVWLGVGAVATMAIIIGIFALSRPSIGDNANRNDPVSNQIIAIEPTVNNNSNNSADEKSVKLSNIENNTGQADKKDDGKTNVDKEKSPTAKKITPAKNESATKKTETKADKQTKKKVTLDDLIN